jgi:hypothetical protein
VAVGNLCIRVSTMPANLLFHWDFKIANIISPGHYGLNGIFTDADCMNEEP